MKIQLIDNWRDMWRMRSVQVAALLGVLGALQAGLPMFQQFVSPILFASLTTLMSAVLIVARAVYQPELHPEEQGAAP